MVDQMEWDPEKWRAGIVDARANVETAASFINGAGATHPEWDRHRPVIELLYYMCKLVYDLKVLLERFFADPDNRAVWEGFLALEVSEGLTTARVAMGRARKEIGREGSPSGFTVEKFSEAAREYNLVVKSIQGDSDLMVALGMLRNGVAAHHGVGQSKHRQYKEFEESVAWTLSSMRVREEGSTPFQSQIAESAVRLANALIDFANALSGVGQNSATTKTS